MKFLVVEQDLRVSGTSQGIISRSFLGKLRRNYPKSQIDVVYLRRHEGNDQLELLPVDNLRVHVLNIKTPFLTKWINKMYWRTFHVSLRERHIHNVYASHISKIDYQNYDHIFIRSAGLDHETILATADLPILTKSIVNFHDPYPLYWYAGTKSSLTNLELFRLKAMNRVVSQGKACMSSAFMMSRDMEYLYGGQKHFFTLPHQYCEEVFDLSDRTMVFEKRKEVTISYHGAIQFGRDIFGLLNAYEELLLEEPKYKRSTELVLRIKGLDLDSLRKRYGNDNVIIMETLNFSNSANEQKEADINIILENGPHYSNILVGKAPFLASTKKPVLSISPDRSELREIITDPDFISTFEKVEIKKKLKKLIERRLISKEEVFPFGQYFDDLNFKQSLEKVIVNSVDFKG